MKIGANASAVLAGCVQNQVVHGSGAEKPARESDREAERHNALLPLSRIMSTRKRFSTQEASSGRNPGGTSGKRCDRAEFQAAFEAASRREFDCLLFWSLDRFSREGVLETLQHLQRLTGYGVAYRSFTESYIASIGPFRDVVISLLAALARQERIRLSERVAAGLARARKEGRVGGRPKVIVSTSTIQKLADQGLSATEIGRQLGCSRMTVARRLGGHMKTESQ